MIAGPVAQHLINRHNLRSQVAGDTVAQARALLKRSRGAWPAVVWQTLE